MSRSIPVASARRPSQRVGHAFLVVTPIGLHAADELAAALGERGIVVSHREAIVPWSLASTRLYVRSARRGGTERAARFEVCWQALDPDDRAERWSLASADDHARLVAHKAALRRQFPGVPLAAVEPGEPSFSLHAFHVPDPDDVDVESLTLDHFVAAARR